MLNCFFKQQHCACIICHDNLVLLSCVMLLSHPVLFLLEIFFCFKAVLSFIFQYALYESMSVQSKLELPFFTNPFLENLFQKPLLETRRMITQHNRCTLKSAKFKFEIRTNMSSVSCSWVILCARRSMGKNSLKLRKITQVEQVCGTHG